MTLKVCSCKTVVTTKNAERVIRYSYGLNFNCPNCKTTLAFKDRSISLKNLPNWFQYEVKKQGATHE